MSATSKRLCGAIRLPKFCHALLVGAFAVGTVVVNAPAMATTITDHITFSITGAYGVPPITTAHGYTNATISGSFDINFDPTVQILPSQFITGVITNLNVSVTDPYFNPPTLTFSPIQYYAFDGAGTLTLSSDPALRQNTRRRTFPHRWYQRLGLWDGICSLVFAERIWRYSDGQRLRYYYGVGARGSSK